MTRKMKDSGIEWIGEIPEDWETSLLSKIALIKTGSTPSKQFLGEVGEIDWIKTNNLKEEKGVTSSDLKIKYKNKNLVTIAKEGATLVSCIGDIGKMAFLYNAASYNQQINAVSFNNNIQPKFGFYLLYSQKEQHKSFSNGNVLQILNSVNQGQVKVAYPELKKQKKISETLDKKTDQIETIKSTIIKEIQTLENYKKSVITEAVTKGLDKNVEMKDSRIEWIGEIPTHWKVNRLKFLVIDRQAGVWGKEVESEGEDRNIICIRVADFDFPRMTIRKDRGFTVRNYSNIDIIKYYLDKGDILVEKSGGGEKSPVGRTIIWEENFVAVYANFIERIRMDQNKIYPMYAQYVFYAFYNMGISNLFFNQTTGIQNLDSSKMIRTLRFPVPSLNDQLNIINYLNKVIKILDETIEAKQKQLETLEEYKKSLIYEYVTGKKEVKDGEES